MPIKTIEQLWRAYRGAVMPQDVTITQLIECRLAFYSGCQSVLSVMRHDVAELSEGEGVETLERWWQELATFGQGGGLT